MVADHLCAACKAYHEEVRTLLTALGVPFTDEPKLVRGLDYYTRTTFEFVHGGLGSQSAVGGGGRYDGLSEMLGGPALPSVGWALGVDRTYLAMEAEGLLDEAPAARVQVYGVPLGEEARRRMFLLVEELRAAGLRVDMAFGGKGLKGAMKGADRSGARFALILGERDLAAQAVQVKDLTTAEQTEVPLAQVSDVLKGKLQ
ncbi:histidine--tRNA ligase [Nonomuraea recticatena]|uniref:histidine--tRNA ligase n=1 Tax=Nonomuraea recticatena TaxID=46178 RepID=UPI00360F511B